MSAIANKSSTFRVPVFGFCFVADPAAAAANRRQFCRRRVALAGRRKMSARGSRLAHPAPEAAAAAAGLRVVLSC